MEKGIDGIVLYRHFSGVTYSRHFSVIFNLFVFCQIFNMIGARKINDEWNTFDGILKNPMFLGVFFVIIAGQIIMVQFGGRAFKIHQNGLTL